MSAARLVTVLDVRWVSDMRCAIRVGVGGESRWHVTTLQRPATADGERALVERIKTDPMEFVA